MAVRAPMRARGYGAGLRARCQCVAERATALKARVLHPRAWNFAVFPILADAVDVKRGDQLCETVSQTSTQLDKVIRTMGS